MKKLIIIFIILFAALKSFSQGYPTPYDNLGSLNRATRDTGGFFVRGTFVAPVYTDTSTANSSPYVSLYNFSEISTLDGSRWYRYNGGWVRLSSGGSGSVNIYNSDGTLTGNRNLNGANNYMQWNDVSSFVFHNSVDDDSWLNFLQISPSHYQFQFANAAANPVLTLVTDTMNNETQLGLQQPNNGASILQFNSSRTAGNSFQLFGLPIGSTSDSLVTDSGGVLRHRAVQSCPAAVTSLSGWNVNNTSYPAVSINNPTIGWGLLGFGTPASNLLADSNKVVSFYALDSGLNAFGTNYWQDNGSGKIVNNNSSTVDIVGQNSGADIFDVYDASNNIDLQMTNFATAQYRFGDLTDQANGSTLWLDALNGNSYLGDVYNKSTQMLLALVGGNGTMGDYYDALGSHTAKFVVSFAPSVDSLVSDSSTVTGTFRYKWAFPYSNFDTMSIPYIGWVKNYVSTHGSGLSYPNTADKYLNGYGNFVTLKLDSLTGTVVSGTWHGTSIDTAYTNAVSNINVNAPLLKTAQGKGWLLSADTSSGATKLATQGFITRGYLPINNPAYTGSLTTGTLGYSDVNILGALQGSANNYEQFILQNTNAGSTASTDIVLSNNLGTSTTYYGDLGINSSAFTGTPSFNLPSATYLSATSGDLAIGTMTQNAIHFVIDDSTVDAMTINTSGAISKGIWKATSIDTAYTNAVSNINVGTFLSKTAQGKGWLLNADTTKLLATSDSGYSYVSPYAANNKYLFQNGSTSLTGNWLNTGNTGYSIEDRLTSATANTIYNGLILRDSTTASSGNQMLSPAFQQTAQGWKTTSTAASQSITHQTYVLPIQGTTNPGNMIITNTATNGISPIIEEGVYDNGGSATTLVSQHILSSYGNYCGYFVMNGVILNPSSWQPTTPLNIVGGGMYYDAVGGNMVFASGSGQGFQLYSGATLAATINKTTQDVLINTTTDNASDKLQVNGSVNLVTAGNKIKIATGSNASAGQSAAMTAGTITISTTAVTSSSLIFLTGIDASAGTATDGNLSVGTITAGTSFVINSSLTTDTRKVNWIIIN